MKVNLRAAEPNPFRDFKIDPVDNDHVAKLVASIEAYDFWGGLVARRKPGARGVFQIIGGWHRREAALKAGIEDADVFVGDFDDTTAVQAYERENATQRGHSANALAGPVAAAIRLILLDGLFAVDSNSKASDRGKVRDGVGREEIAAKLPDVPDNVIRQQLANLKASGDYDRIRNEVLAAVEAERAAELEALRKAEEARKDAERREAEAKAAREKAEADKRKAREERDRREREAKAARDAQARRDAEIKRKEAEHRAADAEARRKHAAEAVEVAKRQREAAIAQEKAHGPAKATRERIKAVRAQKAHEVTFDLAGVSKHLRLVGPANPSHVETFRKLAVNKVPVDQQGALAKKLADKARTDGKEITSEFIVGEFAAEAASSDFLQRIANEKERAERRAQLLRENWHNKMSTKMRAFSGSARGVLAAASKMDDLHRNRPEGVTLYATQEFRRAVESLKAALRIVEGQLIEAKE